MDWYCLLPLFCLHFAHVETTSPANSYDNPLNFVCPHHNQFINHIQSVHNNHREDRVFTLECKDIPASTPDSQINCYKTAHVNSYDHEVIFLCKPDYYINGIHSVHNNGPEDRIWQYTCCHIPEYQMHGCKYTGWTNSYDGLENFYVEHDYVLTGVMSRHSNRHE